jgi:hypothetical protein
MAMNRLLNSLDELCDAIQTIENDDYATRIRRFLIDLLHKEERNLNHNDPNSPYTRFASRGDAEGNRLRLFQALQEQVNEEESDHELQSCVDLMFETPDTDPYTRTTKILRRYMSYVDTIRTADSGSDSDSDSD